MSSLDCDDVMLALASKRTLTEPFHEHLAGCDDCRALAVDQQTAWRWIARLPEDALESDLAIALPTVDPIVFDIDQEIASGGMGRITKATDRRLGREVALKEVLDLSLRARFEREAMITARLQHPAIVPIYEAGTFPNGHPFYTMRLVWGGTLGGAIEQAKTMPKRLALLPHVIAVTDALAYAHSHRIIHRDLKPGNVLVGEFGETVVIDWGLAKELGTLDAAGLGELPMRVSSPNLTRIGSVLGTPGFMSPEQASGGAIDERADVYALGAILYNLLAGTPPYWDTHGTEGSTKLIAIGLEQPPTPIAQAAPDAPADLRTIVDKAMARKKEDRYPTAQEMAQELRRFAAGQLIAREYSLRELIGRWIAKHRTAVAVGAIAFVALAAVLIFAFVNIASSRGAEREARREAESSQQDAIAQRDTAQRTAAELQENEGIRELRDGDGSRAYAYLVAAYAQRTPDAASRYLLTAAARDLMLEIDHHAATTSTGAPREVGKAIAFSGDRVVIVDAADRRLVIRRAGTLEKSLALGADAIQHATFAPSGALVAIGRVPAALEIWDVGGLIKQKVPGLDPNRVVFDRGGKRMAAAAGKRLAVYAIGSETPVLDTQLPEDIRDLAIDDESVSACGKWGVAVWRFDAREPVKLAADCSLLAYLDPKQLVIVHNKSELRRWPIGTPAADKTMSGHIPINVIAVHREKQRIATGDATGVVMWRFDGTALGESRDITGGIDKLRFTADGASFVGAGADDRVFVWDTDSFHLKQAFGGKRGAVTAIAVDERSTIATLSEYRAQVWKMPRGRLLDHWKSDRFVLAGTRVITMWPGELTAHSLGAPPEAEMTFEHGIDNVIDLRASATRLTARSASKRFTVDLKTYNSAKSDSTSALSAHPRSVLEVEPTHVRIIDLESPQIRDYPADHPLRAVLSADGEQLAIVLANQLAWLTVAAEPVRTIDLPEGHQYEVEFDPKGETLVLYGPHLPTLIVTRTGSRTLTADAASGAAWSGDGKRLALGVSNTVQLWDLGTMSGEPRPRFTVSSALRDSYALDRAGVLLAVGSVDGSVRIFDDRGRAIDRLVGSQQTITALAFAVDDTQLVAQSEDRTVTVWDVHVDAAPLARGPWKLEGAQLVPALQ